MLPLPLLAAFAGLCFATIGISYRLGQRKGVAPMSLALVLGAVGSACFAVASSVRGRGEFHLPRCRKSFSAASALAAASLAAALYSLFEEAAPLPA